MGANKTQKYLKQDVSVLFRLPTRFTSSVFALELSKSRSKSLKKREIDLYIKSTYIITSPKAKRKSKRFSLNILKPKNTEKVGCFPISELHLTSETDILTLFPQFKALQTNHLVFLTSYDNEEMFLCFSFDKLEKKIEFKRRFGEIKSHKSIFNSDSPNEIKILKKLGKGHFGSVYSVTYKSKHFAMKLINLEENEANFDFNCNERVIFDELKAINNKNLLKFHACYVIQSKLVLITEMCNSGNLFHFIRKKRSLTETTSLFILNQVLNGLKALHSLRIAHRDIKPENIMLTNENVVKLLDFGLSKKLSKNNLKSFDILGTPYYQAPEMLRGLGHNLSVDFWQIGLLLFELLFGYPLFYSPDVAEIERKIRSKGTIFLPNNEKRRKLRFEMIDFILSLLVREPTDRLGYKRGVQELLEHDVFTGIEFDKVRDELKIYVENYKEKGEEVEPQNLNSFIRDIDSSSSPLDRTKVLGLEYFA